MKMPECDLNNYLDVTKSNLVCVNPCDNKTRVNACADLSATCDPTAFGKFYKGINDIKMDKPEYYCNCLPGFMKPKNSDKCVLTQYATKNSHYNCQ